MLALQTGSLVLQTVDMDGHQWAPLMQIDLLSFHLLCHLPIQ